MSRRAANNQLSSATLCSFGHLVAPARRHRCAHRALRCWVVLPSVALIRAALLGALPGCGRCQRAARRAPCSVRGRPAAPLPPSQLRAPRWCLIKQKHNRRNGHGVAPGRAAGSAAKRHRRTGKHKQRNAPKQHAHKQGNTNRQIDDKTVSNVGARGGDAKQHQNEEQK